MCSSDLDVTVVFDATTVGMGIFEAPIGVELLKGENAAKVLVKALEYYGYSYECNGTLDVGFYFSRIMRYDSFPDKVLHMPGYFVYSMRTLTNAWMQFTENWLGVVFPYRNGVQRFGINPGSVGERRAGLPRTALIVDQKRAK